jgi:hypothetical protein
MNGTAYPYLSQRQVSILRSIGALLPLFGYEPGGPQRRSVPRWTKEMSKKVGGWLESLEQEGLVRRTRNGRGGMATCESKKGEQHATG